MVGKQHRDAFPKRSLWSATQRLQVVHADIYGPIKRLSNSKKMYFISFIDDYSHKVWIYFLVGNSEVFAILKNIKKILLRKRLEILFVVCTQTEVESSPLTRSIFLAKVMVLVGNLSQSSLSNKMIMEYLSARIEQA